MKYLLSVLCLPLLVACSTTHSGSFRDAYTSSPQSPTLAVDHDPYTHDRPRGLYPFREVEVPVWASAESGSHTGHHHHLHHETGLQENAHQCTHECSAIPLKEDSVIAPESHWQDD